MWMDPLAQAFIYMSAYNLIGEGPVVTTEDEEATKKIREFNGKINANYETIDDWLINNWIDSMHSNVGSVWVVKYRQSDPEMPELWRLPPETLQMDVDYRNGWVKFIQSKDFVKYYRTYDQFMRGNVTSAITDKNYDPISIAVDPEITTWVKLFKRPPMAAASKFVVFKHIVMFFMRKYGEKMWAPLILAKIGKPGTDQYPHTDEEMYEAQRQILDMLFRSKNFGYGAVAGNTDIDVVEPKGNGELYLKYIEAMDEQIMYALFASMSLKSGATVYKGSDEERESRKNFLLGVRKEFTTVLKRLWSHVVVPGYDQEKIKVEWPPIRSSTVTDLARSFEVFAKSGVFVDAQERRNIASQVFPELRKRQLTSEENKKLDDLFVTMMAPSQPDESTAGIVNKSGSNNSRKTGKGTKKTTKSKSKK